MMPITARTVPLLALLLGPTAAFVPSLGRGSVWPLTNAPQAAFLSSSIRRPTAYRASTFPMSMMASSDSEGTAEERAARLRETAAAFRAEAQALEDKRELERRAGADRSFSAFDSNQDGSVGIAELRAGLEGPLKKTFASQLTARMGRKPTPEEVEAKIAELPGGSLFPDDLARKLIDIYDQNGDGLLQQSEFAPTEELRARLESIFRERREEELEARAAEKQKEKAEKMKADGKGAISMGDSNDATATATDKALCALPYILPLSDGIMYAQHIFRLFPEQMAWAEPLASVLIFFNNLPFATLIMFFGLSIAASNQQVNKLVRFNMLQAVNLDIGLIAPAILGSLVSASLGEDAYKLEPFANVGADILFVLLLAAVGYSVAASATGTFPNKLPFFGGINRENPDRES